MSSHVRNLLAGIGVVALLAGVGLGYWWGQTRPTSPATSPAITAPAERTVLYWYDPMVPDQHFDKPGKSPFMDMQLVPKYGDDNGAAGVAIAPGVQQNLGVRTAVAQRGSLAAPVRVPGTVSWNLAEEHVIGTPVEAVVERLFVRAPFAVIEAGTPLVRLRAPTWSAALAEARALGRGDTAIARQLAAAGHERLRALGLPSGARIDASGAVILIAPTSGVVSEIGVREGQSVPAGALLLRINGTRTVWVDASVPPSADAAMSIGTPAQVTIDALPGRTFDGEVAAWLPQVEAATRTQRARIVLDNPQGELVAGQFAQVTLQPRRAADVVLVPASAVIADGLSTRVIVQDASGRFVPTAVRTGRSGGGRTEIREGLRGSERVVVSGQFLIDSEASLSGALDRLGDPEPSE